MNTIKNWNEYFDEDELDENDGSIKLGDSVTRAKVNATGITIGDPRRTKRYRVVGLNPKVKLQQIILVNGEEELGEELIEIDDSIVNLLKPLGNLKHAWIADF